MRAQPGRAPASPNDRASDARLDSTRTHTVDDRSIIRDAPTGRRRLERRQVDVWGAGGCCSRVGSGPIIFWVEFVFVFTKSAIVESPRDSIFIDLVLRSLHKTFLSHTCLR
jgi:hypothetical protein